MLERVKGLCRDPAMVKLALTSLLYLVMMRPPVRELALDAVEDVWRTCKSDIYIAEKFYTYDFTDDDAKDIAAQYLTKWRPGFLERNSDLKKAEEVN